MKMITNTVTVGKVNCNYRKTLVYLLFYNQLDSTETL